MRVTRRQFLGTAAAATALALPGWALAETLQKLRVIMPGAATRPYLDYVYGAEGFGFNKKLGLTADYNGVQGSGAALQLLVAGEGDIVHLGILEYIAAKLKQPSLPTRLIYCQDYASAYVMAVPDDSPVKSIADLKDKTIGVLSLSSGAVPTAKAQLREAGVDPNSVTIVPTGAESGALAGLKSKQVDAVNYHIGTIGVMENLGAKFRLFTPKIPSTGFAVSDALLAKNRDLVVRGMQGVVLSTIVTLANPAAAVRDYYKQFGPPQGDLDTALLNDTRPWGELREEEWGRLVAFAGPDTIPADAKLASFFDSSLLSDINKADTSWAYVAAKAAPTL
jgi:NitT/TauT family transport system substrate-binding protein